MDKQLFNYLQTYLTERRRELFNKVISNRTRHFAVVTEDIFQLHNTSAVMRSCDVFGIQDLYVIEERFEKKINKEIAMGVQKWVSIKRDDTTRSCIESLRKENYQIIATTPHNNSQILQDFDVTKRAVFFWNKKKGLSKTVLKEADGFLKIPIYGFS